MQLLKDFDRAIAEAETLEKGYQTEKGFYHNYLSNDAWNTWIKGMAPEHRNQFNKGSGGELEEKNGRPPKMASFASSSRMIYQLSKDIPGFCFEKQLPTKIGGIANLDGYLECSDVRIFIEAKCREPYSHDAVQIIKQNYKPLYTYLREKMPRRFNCVMEEFPDSQDMRVVFFCKGEPVVHFDIKQMICHMLGVACDMLTSTAQKPALFLYLLYNPAALQLSAEYSDEISSIYRDTCQAATGFDMETMFGHIVEYLIGEGIIVSCQETAEQVKKSFRFTIADQNSYREILPVGYLVYF